MKAIKSDLAKDLLADPAFRKQIRHSVAHKQWDGVAVPGVETDDSTVVVRRNGSLVRYARVVVPKAA